MDTFYEKQTFSKKPPLHRNGQLLLISKRSNLKKQGYPQSTDIIKRYFLKKKPRDFPHIDAKI
jgi:hypothetical protein